MIDVKVLASGSKGNCYLIHDGKTYLLIDAGIPIKEIERKTSFMLSQVDGAFISHRHLDHSKAVKSLLERGVDVYAGLDVFTSSGVNINYHCKVIQSRVDNREGKRPYRVNSFSVYPFAVHHDVPNFGFYIHSSHTRENLLYFTDTFYVAEKFPHVNYLMCECNYDGKILSENVNNGLVPWQLKARLVKSHMSIDTLLDMIEENDFTRLKRIYLLHLSDKNSNGNDFKEKIQEKTGCEVYIC